MKRPLITTLLILTATSGFGQTVLLNTRLHPSETLTRDDPALQLDLQEFFQSYPSPGPVATFRLSMPEQDGVRELLIATKTVGNETVPDYDESGATRDLMTYKLSEGGSYSHFFEVSGSDFLWKEEIIEFQLLPEEAPITVANFLTYINRGAYEKTVIHRNDSTGESIGRTPFSPLPILQTGALRIPDDPDSPSLFEYNETLPPIVFEETRSNTQGTLSMARQTGLDTATSQFFVNLEDNSNSLGSRYAVFGELIDMEPGIEVLDEYADTLVWDLSPYLPRYPVSSIPMYAPYYLDWASFVRIESITVPEGDPSGISYAFDFVDEDGELSDEEAANQASFDIQIDGSSLTIQRIDTGAATIEITGTNGTGESRSFQIELIAYNPDALAAFPTATIRQGGNLESDWYGIFKAENYPWIVHANHGNQYVQTYEDSVFNVDVPMYYDFNLESYLYTDASFYPTIYVYSLEKWVQYVEDTGNGTDEDRWFYVFDGDSSGFFKESEL